MRKLNLKSASTVLVAVLALTLVLTAVFAVGGDVAVADNTPNGTLIGEFGVAHVSDIHYFPLEYCYQDTTAEDFKSSDFFYSTTGDTKMVLESGNILYANIMRMLDMAKEGNLPLYVFATGDLTKNGERVAHRDVSNSLRYLQNEVRKLGGDYANFQIFAAVGNHDLYNGSGALYDKDTGDGWDAEGVTTAQWALMYNGLGYPAFDLATLSQIYPDDYWASDFTSGYHATTLATNIDITYINQNFQDVYDANKAGTPLAIDDLISKYLAIGDNHNQLSFAVDILDSSYSMIVADTTLREMTEEFVPVLVSKAEYDILTSNGADFDHYDFYLTKGDTGLAALQFQSEKATKAQVDEAYANGDPVYRQSGYSHLCGGRISAELFEFMEGFALLQEGEDGIEEPTIITCFHQNLLPHFEVEDDILKDFTFYNWEYTAKRFAELGIRYSLSGHQHSSDVMTYTDAEGRTIYDMQTGSFVSLDSPMRILTVDRYNVEGKLAEKAESSIFILDTYKETVLKETPSNHVFDTAPWDENAYQTAMTAYNNASDKHSAWLDVVAANPNYLAYTIKHDDFSTMSYNEYIVQEIYAQLVPRVLSHFLDGERLRGTVDGLIGGLLGPDSPSLKISFIDLDQYKPVLSKMANYLIETVWTGLYPDGDGNGYGDYEYDGVVYDNVIDWVSAVADSVIGIEFGDEELGKLTLAEMAVYIFSSACSGNEIYSNLELPEGTFDVDGPYFTANTPYDNEYRLRFQAAIKDISAQADSGALIETLLSTLLDPLFNEDDSLLRTLLNFKFDFTKATGENELTANDISKFNALIKLLKTAFGINATVDNFVLVDVVNGALPILGPMLGDLLGFTIETTDIIGFLEGFLDDYLVDSFFKGLGGIAKYIIVSYASDDTPDLADITDPTKPLTLAPYTTYASALVGGQETSLTYLSGKASENNPASTVNGRLPGSLTANFDTVDGEDTFRFSYYTAEEIFTRVEYRKKGDYASDDLTGWISVTGDNWNIFDEVDRLSHLDSDNFLYSKVVDGNVTIETKTAPAYIPLIDLGILCITHSEVSYENEDGEEIYFTALDRHSVLENSVIFWNRHSVTITGLDADSEYEYRIYGQYYNTDGDLVEEYFYTDEDGNAKTFTFKTAKSDGDFEFLAVADPQGMTQAMYDETKSVFDAINSTPATSGYDFIINAGDMVDSGKNFYQWQYALNTMIDTYANTSMFFAAGNHEGGSLALEKYFNYTKPSTVDRNDYGEALQDYYSFDYASGHFVVLDTNDADEKGLGKDQLAWLEDDLASTDKDFIFVIMHKSLFSTGAHANDVEVVAMREQLVPIFDDYGVDMVFGGHDHVYAETYPIGASGTVYVTLGTIGTKFYNYTNDNEDVALDLDYDKTFQHTLNEQTFGYVKVVDGELYYNCYSVTALQAINAFNKAYDEMGATVSGFDGTLDNCPLFDSVELPEHYSFVFYYEGEKYLYAEDIKLKNGDNAIDVYVANFYGDTFYVGSFNVTRESNTLAIALIVVGVVVVVAGATLGGVFGAKAAKKKKALASNDNVTIDDASVDDSQK